MQKTQFDANKAQRVAEENERRIIKFKNIDNESFTHSFRGISITVKPGVEHTCRFPEGDHLALHLSRKMLARAKKKILGNKKAGTLYKDNEVNELKEKMLTPVGSETPEKLTAEEERKRDLEQIKEKYDEKEPAPEVSKADVIKDLKAKGVEPDIKKSKDELLAQLVETEAEPK